MGRRKAYIKIQRSTERTRVSTSSGILPKEERVHGLDRHIVDPDCYPGPKEVPEHPSKRSAQFFHQTADSPEVEAITSYPSYQRSRLGCVLHRSGRNRNWNCRRHFLHLARRNFIDIQVAIASTSLADPSNHFQPSSLAHRTVGQAHSEAT